MARITFTLDAWAVFDGTNEDEIRAVAGDQYAGRDGDALTVLGGGGRPEPVAPGWAVYRAAGAARATVCSPEAWTAMGGPRPGTP